MLALLGSSRSVQRLATLGGPPSGFPFVIDLGRGCAESCPRSWADTLCHGYICEVKSPRNVALVLALSLVGALVSTSPAQAAEQPLFGTTVDVFAVTSGDSLLEGVAHVSATGALIAQLDSALGV